MLPYKYLLLWSLPITYLHERPGTFLFRALYHDDSLILSSIEACAQGYQVPFLKTFVYVAKLTIYMKLTFNFKHYLFEVQLSTL